MAGQLKTYCAALIPIILSAQVVGAAEKVRIAVSSKSLGFLNTWAARERGFYRKHGIEAEIIAMPPPLTISAIQAGEIDYAFGAGTIARGSISGASGRLVSLSLRQAIKTFLDQQGKLDLPRDRVANASVVEEVLRERR